MPSFSLPTSKDESNHYHSISCSTTHLVMSRPKLLFTLFTLIFYRRNVSQRSMLFNTIKITLNWPLVWEYCLLPRIEIFIF